MSILLSKKGKISSVDLKSTRFYTILLIVVGFSSKLIDFITPFLHLQTVIIDNKIMTLTLGNIVAIILFICGVIAKKLNNDGDAVEKQILGGYLDNKTDSQK